MTRKNSMDSRLKKLGLVLMAALPIQLLASDDTGLSDSLRQALEAQGWQAEQTQDGSLIYRQIPEQGSQGRQQPVTTTLAGEDLGETLQQRGWQMEWSPGGSLILKPQSQAVQQSAAVEPKTEAKSAEELPDLPGFDYWRIEKQPDGSLHFHPLTGDAGAVQPSAQAITLGRCDGVQIQDVAIQLPVNEWGQAKALAQGWVDNAALEGLLVGRIRRVLGVYLVSLVADTAPHHLKHQIVIRASDGRVILLE